MKDFWRRYHRFIIVGAVAIFAFARLHVASKRIAFFAFQTRDLDRALEVATGNLILWGPELTGGGHLPGGLYYWLMALPLAFDTTWVGPWYVIALLWSIAQVLIFSFLWRWIGLQAAFVGFMVFFPTWLYMHFLNLSAVPVFVVTEVCALAYAFITTNPVTRRRAWIICGLATGFALHLHFSAIVILVAGVILQLIAPKLKMNRLPAGDFLLGPIACFLPVLPFLIFSVAANFGVTLGLPMPGYSGESSEALPALLFLANGFWSDLFSVEALMKLFLLLPLPLVLAGMAGAFVGGASLPARGDRLRRQLRRVLLVAGAVSFVPASYYLVRPNGLRYIIPFMIIISGLTALAYLHVTRESRRAWIYSALGGVATLPLLWLIKDELLRIEKFPALLPAFMALVAVGLCSFFGLHRPRLYQIVALGVSGVLLALQVQFVRSDQGVPRLPLMSVKSMRQAVRLIYSQTGWDYETARHRLFFISAQMGISVKYVYHEIVRGFKRQGRFIKPVSDDLPDGYFITNSLEKADHLGEDDSESVEDFKSWLLLQPLQSDLIGGIREGGIEIGNPVREDQILVVPYWVIDKKNYPLAFNNVGYPYENFAENGVFKNLNETHGAKRISENEALFFWRDCPNEWCAAGMRVQFERGRDILKIRTRILGPPLEQVSEWTGPGWTQLWIKPYLSVTCGSKTNVIPLLDSIGINIDTVLKVSGMNQAYNSFLAPIERLAEVPCSGELRELRAGRSSTLTYTISGPKRSTSPEVALNFQRKTETRQRGPSSAKGWRGR